MEFRIEGILETILVGAVSSLFLLSLLFLFFGHVFHVGPVRRLAKLALYETEVELREEHQVRKREKVEPVEKGDPPMSFAFLLMIALLYGLGATVEALTHDIPLYNDKKIKTDAFHKVAQGRVQGKAAAPDFARFVTDEIACGLARITPQPSVDDSPCQDIYRQEREFYYTAKNAVFQKDTFVHELSPLQARIDFVRSACISLGALAFATLIAALLAGIMEHSSRVKERLKHSRDDGRKTILEHWKDLAALRSLGIWLLLVGFTVVSYFAWKKCENQYDRRVFGYYLSLSDTAISMGAAREHESLPRTSLPISPYRVFSLDKDAKAPDDVPDAAPGARSHQHDQSIGWMGQFEPSAVQTLDRFDQIIVANDKGGANPFVLFSFDHEAGLSEPRVLKPEPGKDWPFKFSRIPKFEALHARTVDGERAEVLALSTSDEPPSNPRVLLRFHVDFANATAVDIQPVAIPDICAAFRDPNLATCLIEGMTMAPSATHQDERLMFGVRHLIYKDNPTAKDKSLARKPIVAVVQLDLAKDGTWIPPRIVYRWDEKKADEKLPDSCLSGVSDLQIQDNKLFILTSLELRENETCDPGSKERTSPIGQVRGALWRLVLDGASMSGKPTLVKSFIHKPEGLALLNDGTGLIVFDDDGSRKSMHRGLESFPLEQHEAVFTVVPISD
ncbi:MAG: hypothetical protein ABJA82_04600 [Myxococcales bacterium]